MGLARLVFDILIPHQPPVIEYATKLESLDNVTSVTINVVEVDSETKTLSDVIEGP